jgi:hypothetical protein
MIANTDESGIKVVNIFLSLKFLAVICPIKDGALSHTTTSKFLSSAATY